MAFTTNEKIPQLRALAVRMVRGGKSTREAARYYDTTRVPMFVLLKKKSPGKKLRSYPPRPEDRRIGMLVQIDTIHFVDKDGRRIYVYMTPPPNLGHYFLSYQGKIMSWTTTSSATKAGAVSASPLTSRNS